MDYWYQNKNLPFKVGDWFYMVGGTLYKASIQEVINIRFGMVPKHWDDTFFIFNSVAKIERISNDKVYYDPDKCILINEKVR